MGLSALSGVAALSIIFLFTALLYASVGFGGGSTYIALLALADTDYRILPIIALVCNIIVVTGGTIRFHLRQLVEWSKIWPILLLSVPAAWAGGRIEIDQSSFLVLLGFSLIIAAILLLIEPLLQKQDNEHQKWTQTGWFPPFAGIGIGFLSGMVGIGGGIFLAPILLLLKWADSRRIAATASVFILVNSLAGLTGQLMKPGWQQSELGLFHYWPLFIMVLVGGQIGSYLASKRLPERWIKLLTAMLVAYVAIRILVQQFL